jgi:predicted aspartyl protease
MATATDNRMGKVTTTITITNRIDRILAERGFIPPEQIRSVVLKDVLVDTGTTRLCLPANIINDLGLVLQGEVDVKITTGVQKLRIFREINLAVEGREGTYNCMELPDGADPLLGLLPLEDLGLEPDLQNQRLRVLPIEGNDTYLTVL